MHNLLIADDDEIMRAGIEKNIDWESNRIHVVGAAHNGQECLEMIPSCLPDLILTDIKMPFMDGIQLTEAVYRLYPQIKVVLLTAYGDFKYAQMALNYKVCQYVMKYEANSVILEAVKKAAREFDDQKDSGEMLNRSRELLRGKYLYDLAAGEESTQKAEQLGFRFLDGDFCALCAEISQKNGNGNEPFWQAKQLCEDAGASFREKLSGKDAQVYYFTGDVRLNLVVSLSAGETRMEEFCKRLEEVIPKVEKELNLTICVGVGTRRRELESVAKSYADAVQALEFKNIMEGGQSQKIILADAVKNGNVPHMAVLKQILAFIAANYHQEDLSLNRIADEVHLTPSYISTLFKKYQGVNISDYLIDIRIRKAMELLTGTDLKTYEISERIGYSNPQYFSVVFKRTAGMSPMEYRKSKTGKAE